MQSEQGSKKGRTNRARATRLRAIVRATDRPKYYGMCSLLIPLCTIMFYATVIRIRMSQRPILNLGSGEVH